MSLQHERMGSASLNLLGGLNEDRVEEDSSSFRILNDNVREKLLDTLATEVHKVTVQENAENIALLILL